MLRRIATMVWKEALQFGRYKLLLIFILIFPAVDMLGACDAVSTQIMHIPTAVYDQDRSPSSRRLVSMLRGSRLFDPDYYVGSQAEMEELGPIWQGGAGRRFRCSRMAPRPRQL
jgi:ABC-2 type transport system permease protein